MKLSSLFVGLSLFAAAPISAQTDSIKTFPPLEFADALPRQWSLMYREFKTEFLQCVYAVPNDSALFVVVAHNANMPPSQSRVHTAGHLPTDSLLLELCPWHGASAVLLGLAHPHKNVPGVDLCNLSDEDRAFAFKTRKDPLAFVICGPTRFAIYSYMSFERERLICDYNPEAIDVAVACKLETLSKSK